ncbi:MAG TPA: hypothetical protein VGM12_08385 [Trebonia sp.]|jgi:hypothetical protein
MGEQDELHDRHPPEQPDLEGRKRQEVRLGREFQPLPERQMAHRRDDEVLEQGVFHWEREPGQLQPAPKTTHSAIRSPRT